MNPNFPMTVRRMNVIRAALSGPARTLFELADDVCMCFARAKGYVDYLHGQGEVYIASWPERKAGKIYRTAAYRMGNRPDAPRPARLTSAQRQAAHVARIRLDQDKYDRHKAASRARKVPRTRDPLVAALFGAAMPGARAITAEVQP